MARPYQKDLQSEEFTAKITIKQSRVVKIANANGYFDDPAQAIETELVDMKITSDSLEALRGKLHAHIDLADALD